MNLPKRKTTPLLVRS